MYTYTCNLKRVLNATVLHSLQKVLANSVDLDNKYYKWHICHLVLLKRLVYWGMDTILYYELRSKFHKHFFSCFIIIIIIITIPFCKTLIYKIEYLSISHKFNILQFDNDTKYIRQRRMRSHIMGLYV